MTLQWERSYFFIIFIQNIEIYYWNYIKDILRVSLPYFTWSKKYFFFFRNIWDILVLGEGLSSGLLLWALTILLRLFQQCFGQESLFLIILKYMKDIRIYVTDIFSFRIFSRYFGGGRKITLRSHYSPRTER